MSTSQSTTKHEPCDEIIEIRAKMKMIEEWKTTTQADLKEIRDVVSQVKLLMSLSIGGGGLSILSLVILIIELIVKGNQ